MNRAKEILNTMRDYGKAFDDAKKTLSNGYANIKHYDVHSGQYKAECERLIAQFDSTTSAAREAGIEKCMKIVREVNEEYKKIVTATPQADFFDDLRVIELEESKIQESDFVYYIQKHKDNYRCVQILLDTAHNMNYLDSVRIRGTENDKFKKAVDEVAMIISNYFNAYDTQYSYQSYVQQKENGEEWNRINALFRDVIVPFLSGKWIVMGADILLYEPPKELIGGVYNTVTGKGFAISEKTGAVLIEELEKNPW